MLNLLVDQKNAQQLAQQLAQLATQALIEEVRLTPKPGLVDQRNSGAHSDLTLELMEHSAHSLTDTFYAIAKASYDYPADASLRAEIGHLGRIGETAMLEATGGINTHRGAIWALGLIVSAAAMHKGQSKSLYQLTHTAAALARIDDPRQKQQFSKGKHASMRYRIPGAREQAQQGFPHVVQLGLPQLRQSRRNGASETHARVDALLAVMATLTDTCVLSRGGLAALDTIHHGAREVLAAGGMACARGQQRFTQLDRDAMQLFVSPGGAADLLSATLLLDWLAPEPTTNPN
ncbi:triphosphoribosyl-dephospho-CoA synthase [Celerinatantimonas diazotrophica]|uniref:Probable 2-(5''-triphosphoribosyl)-3'-dephosphocoenzyme-A synthase n=1 Tax=Celerinatantimonas diazotrophica TaxID=412034 RepID=A0A4R1K345_9GAMM|nr:triphosphoribosyl-dephospho-CoA synthase [Celerinatantimonas diazotrophica]TCK58113.1 triphosphoribosyl-dephospho-CoA synthase [Celerinatantimonas diazotrophica]CAG9297815.1 2-(5''-triphosphoribosyl)-3'-dephosphocoenzyme-A synthase [Celerinatantimonas diazotrophica]